MQTQTHHMPFAIRSEAFREGFTGGTNGNFRGVRLTDYLTEEVIVKIITNLTEIAQEGWLTEDLIRRNAGIIAGWLARCMADNGLAHEEPLH